MQSLQADDLKEKEKENEKLLHDLEEKRTKCSKLVTKLLPCFFVISCFPPFKGDSLL